MAKRDDHIITKTISAPCANPDCDRYVEGPHQVGLKLYCPRCCPAAVCVARRQGNDQ